MRFWILGCNHRSASIDVRERLAFSEPEIDRALAQLRAEYSNLECVLLSTCNRVEIYTASESESGPGRGALLESLFHSRGAGREELEPYFYEYENAEAVRHLFEVASSLDSMVVGEAQIPAQVRQAYQFATARGHAGKRMHVLFQSALKAARRIAGETEIQKRRVSIPSVAVADFASQIFDRFDDKNTLVVGAGEMAEETLRYLFERGAGRLVVVNRTAERAAELAARWNGAARPWDQLLDALAEADLVVSTTGASEPIVRTADFERIAGRRGARPLFVLDLAVPRDFEPAISDRPGVYLYSVDDLKTACDRNRAARDRELPAARRILDAELDRFFADLHLRATSPVLQRLQQDWERLKEEELRRLYQKLPELDDRSQSEIARSFDRFVGKLLHPPMESLRDESRHGIPGALIEALAKLFRIKD